MKETLCPRCGESVVFVDYGDNPSFLSGKCEGCGLSGDYILERGFAWEVISDKELRLGRARTALRKAIQSENAKYNPCTSLINAYQDGLDALEGVK